MNYYIGKYYALETDFSIPIQWNELERTEDGKSLLITNEVIDCSLYDDDDIREYLDDFLKNQFSDEERSVVIPGEKGSLFLLNENEIKRYFPSPEERSAILYDHYGEEIDFEYWPYWISCDSSTDRETIPFVTAHGKISHIFSEADEIGLRIAMWVDTEKAKNQTAKNGHNSYHDLWDDSEDY